MFDHHWKYLLPLLHGIESDEIFETCQQAVLEQLAVDELPDLLHEIVFEYLLSENNRIRIYSAQLLKALCTRFRLHLLPLLAESRSDGQLVGFHDWTLQTLLDSGKTLGKGNQSSAPSSSSAGLESGRKDDIYSKRWFEKQRRRMQRILVKTSGSAEIGAAFKYNDAEDLENIIGKDDMGGDCKDSNIESEFVKTTETNLLGDESAVSDETWFARLFRLLVVTLLDESWEKRDGSARGLAGIVSGIHANKESENNTGLSFLPDFLVDDILCLGSTVLVIDRFIDFDDSPKNSVSDSGFDSFQSALPVKSSISELLVKALMIVSSSTEATLQKVLDVAWTLSKLSSQWILQYGGILLLSNLVEHIPHAIFQNSTNILNLFEVLKLGHDYDLVQSEVCLLCSHLLGLLTRKLSVLSPTFYPLFGNQCEHFMTFMIQQLNDTDTEFRLATTTTFTHVIEMGVFLKHNQEQSLSSSLIVPTVIEGITLCLSMKDFFHLPSFHRLTYQLLTLTNLSESASGSFKLQVPKHTIVNCLTSIRQKLAELDQLDINTNYIEVNDEDIVNMSSMEVMENYWHRRSKLVADQDLMKNTFSNLIRVILRQGYASGELKGDDMRELLIDGMKFANETSRNCHFLPFHQLFYVFRLLSTEREFLQLTPSYEWIANMAKDTLFNSRNEFIAILSSSLQDAGNAVPTSSTSLPKKRVFKVAVGNSSQSSRDNPVDRVLNQILIYLLLFAHLNPTTDQWHEVQNSLLSLPNYIERNVLSRLGKIKLQQILHCLEMDFSLKIKIWSCWKCCFIDVKPVELKLFSLHLLQVFISEYDVDDAESPDSLLVLTCELLKQCNDREEVQEVIEALNHTVVILIRKLLFWQERKRSNVVMFKILEEEWIADCTKLKLQNLVYFVASKIPISLSQHHPTSSTTMKNLFAYLRLSASSLNNDDVVDWMSLGLLALHALSQLQNYRFEFIQMFVELVRESLFADLTERHYEVNDSNISYRCKVASILFNVVIRQQHFIAMHFFDDFIQICIRGIGDYQSEVRSFAVQAFRLLVPLAPLAQSVLDQGLMTHSSSGTSNFIRDLFTKSSHYNLLQSTDANDQKIMQIVSGLMDNNSETSTALREYQWEGVSWWTALRRIGLGGVLADEMGLGKTLQALVCLIWARVEYLVKDSLPNQEEILKSGRFFFPPCLIICPAALTFHWLHEIQRHFSNHQFLAARIFDGDIDSKSTTWNFHESSIIIVSYETLRKYQSHFHQVIWDIVILDEAHLIRNPKTSTTKAIFHLSTRHRLGLTGTPIQNKVEDLWSLMNFLLPEYLGNSQHFHQSYVVPIRKSIDTFKLLKQSVDQGHDIRSSHQKSLSITANGIAMLRKLHKQVLPFVLRRTKDKVLQDLPRKTLIDIPCILSPLQQSMYADSTQQMDVKENEMQIEIDGNSALNSVENESEDQMLHSMGTIYDEIIAKKSQISSLSNLGQSNSQAKPKHIFQIMKYLQLLAIHPGLVVDESHEEYRRSLLESLLPSGKLVQLTRLLMETNILNEVDFKYNPVTTQHDEEESYNAAFENAETFYTYLSQNYIGGKETNDTTNEEDEGQVSTSAMASAVWDESSDGSSDEEDSTCGSSSKVEAHDASWGKKRKLSSDKNNLGKMKRRRQDGVNLSLLQNPLQLSGSPYARLDGSISPQERFMIAQKFNAAASVDTTMAGDDSVNFLHAKSHDISQEKEAIISNLKHAIPKIVHQRQSLKEEASSAEVRILLLTTKSCGLGLNLTKADTVIFVEHDWNPFVDLQAMDRVHRIGQVNAVTVYRLLAESTLESRLMNLQNFKTNMAKEVIAGEEAFQDMMTSSSANEVTEVPPESDNNIQATSTVSDQLGQDIWNSLTATKASK